MQNSPKPPLVVALDGTLTVSHTFPESVIRVIKKNPANLLRLPFWLAGGRAAFEARLAEHADFRPESLSYREALLDYLARERKAGRAVVLATAAHRSIAERVSAHLGLFDQVIASSNGTHLVGAAKLAGIRQHIGGDFVYAGHGKADLPVWAGSTGAILTAASPVVAEHVRRCVPVEREFDGPMPACPPGATRCACING